ncbi:hypothetical protein DL771_008751 [Monosporascus sp. 5C6A]|nr:hypothetical protein DL771_008751 [Monosporascus sp. 5C6A]
MAANLYPPPSTKYPRELPTSLTVLAVRSNNQTPETASACGNIKRITSCSAQNFQGVLSKIGGRASATHHLRIEVNPQQAQELGRDVHRYPLVLIEPAGEQSHAVYRLAVPDPCQCSAVQVDDAVQQFRHPPQVALRDTL